MTGKFYAYICRNCKQLKKNCKCRLPAIGKLPLYLDWVKKLVKED